MFVTVGEWLDDKIEFLKSGNSKIRSTDDAIEAFNLSRSTTYNILKNRDIDLKISYKTYHTFRKNLANNWTMPSRNTLIMYIKDNCVHESYSGNCATCGKFYSDIFDSVRTKYYKVFINTHRDKFPAPIIRGKPDKNLATIVFCDACIEIVAGVILIPYSEMVNKLINEGKTQNEIANISNISTNQGLISRIKRDDIQEQYINKRVALGLCKNLIDIEVKKREPSLSLQALLDHLYKKGYEDSNFSWNEKISFKSAYIDYKTNQKIHVPLLINGISGRDIACFTVDNEPLFQLVFAARMLNAKYLLIYKVYNSGRELKRTRTCFRITENNVVPCDTPPLGKKLLEKVLIDSIVSMKKIETRQDSQYNKYLTREMISNISKNLRNSDKYCEDEDDKKFFMEFKNFYPSPISAIELFKLCGGDKLVSKHIKLH